MPDQLNNQLATKEREENTPFKFKWRGTWKKQKHTKREFLTETIGWFGNNKKSSTLDREKKKIKGKAKQMGGPAERESRPPAKKETKTESGSNNKHNPENKTKKQKRGQTTMVSALCPCRKSECRWQTDTHNGFELFFGCNHHASGTQPIDQSRRPPQEYTGTRVLVHQHECPMSKPKPKPNANAKPMPMPMPVPKPMQFTCIRPSSIHHYR